MAAWSWLERILDPRRGVREKLIEINALIGGLDLEGVIDKCEEILSDPNLFLTDRTPTSLNSTVNLSVTNRRFVDRYASVRMRFGDFAYSRSEVGESSVVSGAIRLCTGTAGAEVICQDGSDPVFVVDGDEPAERLYEDKHGSIWHYVLWMHLTTSAGKL